MAEGSSTVPLKYFEQHEIPREGPADYTYEHTRCLLISLEPVIVEEKKGGKKTEVYKGLQTKMVDAFKTGNYPGVPNKSWYDVTKDFFAVPLIRNPFDFNIWFKSRMVIRLHGDFWQFSRTLHPFTTKGDYGQQYFDLLLHHYDPTGKKLYSLTPELWQQQPPHPTCNCISFFTQRPARDIDLGGPKVVHGFSLNVELFNVSSDGSINRDDFLPITVDPDMENKGGHPGP